MNKKYILIILLIIMAHAAYAAKFPSFMKNSASVISSEYSLIGSRDVEFLWGDEKIWLSEIFETWGRKGTALVWKRLPNEERVRLVENLADDKESRSFYFNNKIAARMVDLLKESVNWITVKEEHLIKWLPDTASDAFKTISTFSVIPDVINDVNITGLPLYKKYTYYHKLLREDISGLREIAFRIARLTLIHNNPIIKDAKEVVIEVIVEDLMKNMASNEKLSDVSPLARTAVAFGTDVLKTIHDDPAFSTFYNNTRRLNKYYARVMRDEIKSIKKHIDKLEALDKQIREKAAGFSSLIDVHVESMQKYRSEADRILKHFIELSEQYRALELSGKVSLMPQIHRRKEEMSAVVIKAERLHAKSVESIETVLAPGDAASARRLIKRLRQPLDEIHSMMNEILTEMNILSQAGGEIGLLTKEINILQWKLDTNKKMCQRYYDFFHRGVLLRDMPSFDPGDTSGALFGRPGQPKEANVLAYSFAQVLRIYNESESHENMYHTLKIMLEKYPVDDLTSPDQRNTLREAQEQLTSIRREYIDSRFFYVTLVEMREELALFGINENDLLDMVRGRPDGLDPEFIETIEGHGIVPATK